MSQDAEVTEAPLSHDELGARYRHLCDNPLFNNVPGKIEIDAWGRMLFLPFSAQRGLVLGRLCSILPMLGGEGFVTVPILTRAAVLVADAAWASDDFMHVHGYETPLSAAPEICVESVSGFNSTKELREKVDAYLAAGAREVWLAYPKSKRFEFYDGRGPLPSSAYPVDLSGVFD
jgi:Uma2 family endonuclease